CWISPVSGSVAARTASRVTSPAGAPEITLPPASPVSLAAPHPTVARYSFSAGVRYPRSRVALPTPATRPPAPLGSRAPPCQRLVGGPRPGDKFLHLAGAFWQGVLDEGQRRGVPQPGLAPNLGADEPGGALQRRGRALLVVRRTVDRVVDRGLAQVAGDLGV